jgi:hypothetical protein
VVKTANVTVALDRGVGWLAYEFSWAVDHQGLARGAVRADTTGDVRRDRAMSPSPRRMSPMWRPA